jgi:hypothetical protein
MRVKNLSSKQFNIQLEKTVNREFHLGDWFSRNHVSDTPTCPEELEDWIIVYPKDFRLIRSLAILQWYLPDIWHWRIFLDLKEKTFSQLNQKQRIEIQLLLESKEIMEIYLFETKRYTGSEIFGNILGNDLKDLLKFLKLRRNLKSKPKRVQRHRGYRDHGSRRPDHQWLPREDYSFTEYQNLKERKLKLQHRTVTVLTEILRALLVREDESLS